MKKILAWILIALLCFSLVSCGGADTSDSSSTLSVEAVSSEAIGDDSSEIVSEDTSSQTVSTNEPIEYWDGITPLLYRVTDDSDNVIWVFGSIHVGRDEFYPFPDYLYYSYANAEVLAVEADIVAFEEDANAQIKALTNMIYMDGTTIKEHIDYEVYKKAVAILTENGMYNVAFDYYCPAFWSSLIDNLAMAKVGIDTSLGIDYNLLWDAKENEKEIEEIESAEFQYKMMADFSEELQELLLASSIASYENTDELLESTNMLLDAWAKGDEEELTAIIASEEEFISPEEKELYEEYKKAVMTDRNIGMTEYAEKALKSGKKTFICVGAAHVIGEGGIIDLLEQKGYKIEPVTISKYPVGYSYLWQ